MDHADRALGTREASGGVLRASRRLPEGVLANRRSVLALPGSPVINGSSAPSNGGVSGPIDSMFGDRIINDGAGMIKLEGACPVQRDAHLRLVVEVNWPMVVANAVARLYIIADANREPIVARELLIPDIVPPHLCLTVRPEGSGFVRAIVECGDGSLLEVKRWVCVMPSEP